MLSVKRKAAGLAVMLLNVLLVEAQATIVIDGTRIIYSEKEKEVTLKLTNRGERPSLVQSWTDTGKELRPSTPDTADAPFLVTPPLTRIDPKKGQTLRLLYTREALPQDRESVFWLNVLDVPPMAQAANYLQIAYRSRIKIFFRPTGLTGDPASAAKSVRWHLVRSGEGYALRGNNDSNYHVSLNGISLAAQGRVYPGAGGMIPPQGAQDFPLRDMIQPLSGLQLITYVWIDDYGASHEDQAFLDH